MPVLARSLEAANLSTVLITMMPFWAEKVGVPRTLAVEFPFGHTLGEPNNATQQTQILHEALKVLTEAREPGTVVHSKATWNEPVEVAIQSWQPEEPSPIIAELSPKFREMIREYRQRGSSKTKSEGSK